MGSIVSLSKLKEQSFDGVKNAVHKAMNLARWQDYIKGNKVFLKLNLLSAQVVPGQCTSPWVFESIVLEILENKPDIEILCGDADVAAVRQFDRAVKNWGIKDIAEKYDIKTINLSKVQTKKVYFGEWIGELKIPKLLTEVDCIVTLPVIKTHCLTTITGSLKNQWGLLPRFRHRYHSIVNHAIPEINKFFKVTFAVADMTISMEGPGPRCGIPKVCDFVLASPDRVALDTVAATIMGFDPNKIDHIVNSEKIGVGTMNYVLVGDNKEIYNFIFPRGDDHLVYRWRDRLQSNLFLKRILFDTPIFDILALIASIYNTKIWYLRYGKKYARSICDSSGYGEEFNKLI